jgi:hypothetical protein
VSDPSPLGRYDDAGMDDELFDVALLNMPVRLMVAGREHHDELMREFALLALSGRSDKPDVPVRLVELTETLGIRYGSAAGRPDELVDAALTRGQDSLDLRYRVPAHAAEAAQTLDRLMTEADEFCISELLLTVQRSPAVIAFSRWYCEEFRRQVAGEPPRPWDGPIEP